MEKRKKPWRKILYEKQDFPDNYVDESFLKDLQKNLHVTYYTIFEAVNACTLVTTEICSVVIFALTFMFIGNQQVKSSNIFIGCVSVAFLLYILNISIVNSRRSLYLIKSDAIKDLKSTGIFFLFGFSLSPILKTLTHSISTDTIYAMTASMMILHLISHDYGIPGAFVSTSISFNSALFSTVCLASRLGNVEDAFVLLTFSLEIFALFPLFRNQLKAKFTKLWLALTITLFITSTYGIYCFSMVCSILFVLVIIFVNIICPVWFVKWQKYKENLYGPWDEAVIET